METNIASRQHVNTTREAIKVPPELKIASAKAVDCKICSITEVRDKSLNSASCEAKIVSDCETIQLFTELSPVCPMRLKLKHFVLTTRLLQPRLHHQYYWVVLGSPLEQNKSTKCPDSFIM